MSSIEKSIEKILIGRPTTEREPTLFEIEKSWEDIWWGMPEFVMKDASPQYRIVINFLTESDVIEFAKISGIRVSTRSDSAWFPPQNRLSGQLQYTGPKVDSKYPICIPSKGRWNNQLTASSLDELGVSYLFFVEETEGDKYKEALGDDKVVVMPFHDLGKGSIPARNYIWQWALERGHKRHWTLDDNIRRFLRCNMNRRIGVSGGGFFKAMEDFVDRYENIAMAGPHHLGFVADRQANLKPYTLNSRIYSCILLDTSLPHRWRGRYNEDTDLSLRLLKDGYCTLLFNALLMDKAATSQGGGGMKKGMAGGNTDHVYNTEDYRLAFAQSLADQHPDCVKVVWKYDRYHHSVDYSKFKRNQLKMKDGIVPSLSINNYGMRLDYVK